MTVEYVTDVGLEIHVQLDTESKMFCSCSARFGAEPNSRCCPVCSGMPGALPTVNRKAVEYAVRVGLMLGCRIAPVTSFDRKNYFYPDLPRGYQITQTRMPICTGGALTYDCGDEEKTAHFIEIHMEDDAGKLIHGEDGYVFADYNRCGVPLLEFVTGPCFHSGNEAEAFLDELILTLRELGISDCRMQEGSLRADVNVSVHAPGFTAAERTEMKNLGSVRAVRLAVEYESARQCAVLERGDSVRRETRRWDEIRNVSEPMREKESREDYRYFPEPDIPELDTSEIVSRLSGEERPMLPRERRRRYTELYGLGNTECRTLTSRRDIRDFFESCIELGAAADEISNWLCGEGMRILKKRGGCFGDCCLTPEKLCDLTKAVSGGKYTRTAAKEIFEALFDYDGSTEECAETLGLSACADAGETERAARAVAESCPQQVKQYLEGKTKVFGYLKGQIMRELRGRGNPAIIDDVLGQFLDDIDHKRY